MTSRITVDHESDNYRVLRIDKRPARRPSVTAVGESLTKNTA